MKKFLAIAFMVIMVVSCRMEAMIYDDRTEEWMTYPRYWELYPEEAPEQETATITIIIQ